MPVKRKDLRLYRDASSKLFSSKGKLVREIMERSGPTVTLIGGKLLGKGIIRGGKYLQQAEIKKWREDLKCEAAGLRKERAEFRRTNPGKEYPFELMDLNGILTNYGIESVIKDYIETRTTGFPAKSFNLWKKLLEAKGKWKAAGFNYIPIESIFIKNGKYRAYKNRDGTYRIFTKVINGINVTELKEKIQLFPSGTMQAVREQATTIVRVVNELGVRHAHFHEGNFMVTFYKGRPRVYLIDFDLATKLRPNEKEILKWID